MTVCKVCNDSQKVVTDHGVQACPWCSAKREERANPFDSAEERKARESAFKGQGGA